MFAGQDPSVIYTHIVVTLCIICSQGKVFQLLRILKSQHKCEVSGSRSAILNLMKLIFFIVYPYLKLHILFNSNGLAVWFGFPHITHTCITKIMPDNFWPP